MKKIKGFCILKKFNLYVFIEIKIILIGFKNMYWFYIDVLFGLFGNFKCKWNFNINWYFDGIRCRYLDLKKKNFICSNMDCWVLF